jgi:hypothetical protein
VGRSYLALLVAAYGLLLRAYPARFRPENGHEMQAVFAEALGAAAVRGPGPALRFAARELAHSPMAILDAHWREWRAGKAMACASRGPGLEMRLSTKRLYFVLGLPVAAWLVLWLNLLLWRDGPGVVLALPLAAGSLAVLAASLLQRSAWSHRRALLVLAGLALVAGLVLLVGLAVDAQLALVVGLGGLLAGVSWQVHASGRNGWRALARLALAAFMVAMPAAWLLLPRVAVAEASRPAAEAFKWAVMLAWPAVAVVLGVRNLHVAVASDSRARLPARLARGAAGAALLAVVAALLSDSLRWDLATDGLEAVGVFLSAILPASGAAFMLVAMQEGAPRRQPGLVLAAGTPVAMFMVIHLALAGTSPAALTQARANALADAIETYHARHQRYPTSLAELPPWYSWRIYEPVVFRNAGWCYQAREDSFRLGYVHQPGFDAPAHMVRIRVVASAGTPFETAWACDEQVDFLRGGPNR